MRNKLQIIGLSVVVIIVSAAMLISNAESLLPSAMSMAIRISLTVLFAAAISVPTYLAASRVRDKVDGLSLPQDEPREGDFGEDAAPQPEIPAEEDLLPILQGAIADYLSGNESTPFFTETLGRLSAQLDSFQKRYVGVCRVLERRFGAGGLSFSKFLSSVDDLRHYLIKLADNLLMKMEAFDEVDYEEKINRFLQQNRLEEAEACRAVENEYKSYARGVSKQFDSAILKTDRLILEMARLSDAELEKVMNALCSIDEAIDNTKLYVT